MLILDALEYQNRIPRMTKRFLESGESLTYEKAWTFDAMEAPISDFDELVSILIELQSAPHLCVVRGELIDPDQPRGIQRTLTTDEPYLRDCAQPWVMLDFDNIDGSDARTIDDRLIALGNHLPREFRDATFFYQWSASAGVKGWDEIKAHLWFWLDTSATSAFLKEKASAEGWLCDKAVLNPAQIHYTAAPIFDVPERDPLIGQDRCGIVKGSRLAVTLDPLVETVLVPINRKTPARGVEGRVRRINEKLDEITGADLHQSVIGAASSYASLWKDEADAWEIREWINERLITCGRDGARIRNEQLNLERIIQTALRKYGR